MHFAHFVASCVEKTIIALQVKIGTVCVCVCVCVLACIVLYRGKVASVSHFLCCYSLTSFLLQVVPVLLLSAALQIVKR